MTVFLIAAGAVAALMLLTWAEGTRRRDISIVDVVWGPAFVLVALVGVLVGDGDSDRRWLLFALTAAWGLRLGAHLLARKIGDPEEDRRYAAMRQGRDRFAPWSLAMVFGVQWLAVMIVSLPLLAGAEADAPLDAWIVPGLALFAVGLAFEAVGDLQLRRFKSDPSTSGQVMDRGLWRYTRHPNYFGDACVWFGLWLVVLPAGGTWWTVIGPAAMTFLLVRVSGKAKLERDIGGRRPGYEDYVRRTSGFFPLPPKAARGG